MLAELLTIPVREPVTVGEVRPYDARSSTLQVLQTLLSGDFSEDPLLLIVEDLHWSDPTTLELLERIVSGHVRRSVACVVTFRPDFQPPWTQWQTTVDVELGPLSHSSVRTLAAAASGETLDNEALRRVELAAEGVPLFVEEMAKSIRTQEPEHPLESQVPPTLQGLLTERLDRLPELAGLIDVAAVLGREFDRGLLETLSELDRPALRSAIAQLTAEEVLRPVEGSRTRLEFRHALLQEVAYERLLRRRRRSLHARVAEVLTSHRPSAWESEPEQIAHHWSCADEPARALPYWERAAQRALTRAAFVEAAAHFRQAVQALDAARPAPDAELERAELLTAMGATLQGGLTPGASVDVIYANARSSFESVGEPDRLIPVVYGEYMFHVTRAQYPQALELAEEMLSMGRSLDQERWLCGGHFFRGFALMMQGELEAARAALEAAIDHYRLSRERGLIPELQGDFGVAARSYLANLLWNQGHAQEADERSRESVELAELVGGQVTLSLVYGMRCGILLVQGKGPDFLQWLEKLRAQSLERDTGYGYWRTVCLIWTAWVAGLGGDAQRQATVLRQHLDRYVEDGARVGIPHFLALLSEVQVAAGQSTEALESLTAAQQHIDLAGERYYEPELQWLMGRLLETNGNGTEAAAAQAYERSIRAAASQNAKLIELRAATGLAIHKSRNGEDPVELTRVRTLCEWFGADSWLPDVRRARKLLDRSGVSG